MTARTLIPLPDGVFLLGHKSLRSSVFIRGCYVELLHRCLDIVNDTAANTPHVILHGNPGIGKIFFGYALLMYFARTNQTVVYERSGLLSSILFSNDVIVQGPREGFEDILNQPTTYYIADAMVPVACEAKTFLLTSPNRSIWWQYGKNLAECLFMPVWTLRETLRCRELLFPLLTESIVRENFRRWGGIAQYVLEYASCDETQQSLADAIAKADLHELVKACGRMEDADADKVSHRLLHFHVDHDFDVRYMVFASEYVRDAVYQRLLAEQKDALLRFMASADRIQALAVLRGYLFEAHAHAMLERGGRFRIRRLVDHRRAGDDDDDDDEEMDDEEIEADDEDATWYDSEDEEDSDGDDMQNDATQRDEVDERDEPVQQLELIVSKTKVFTSDQDVTEASNGTYLWPQATNYAAVDAIMKPNRLFQVTGAHKHPCKMQHLKNVLTLLGDPDQSVSCSARPIRSLQAPAISDD